MVGAGLRGIRRKRVSIRYIAAWGLEGTADERHADWWAAVSIRYIAAWGLEGAEYEKVRDAARAFQSAI